MIQKMYGKYSAYLITSLLLTTVGCLLGMKFAPNLNPLVLGIGSLVLMLGFLFSKGAIKESLFWLFCFGEGLMLSPLIAVMAEIDITLILQALFATTGIVTVFLLLGLWVKDLSWLGVFLFYGLLTAVLVSIASFFFAIPDLWYLGIALFSLYVSYDINRFKNRLIQAEGNLSHDEILGHVMSQYLNILNLFIRLLRQASK